MATTWNAGTHWADVQRKTIADRLEGLFKGLLDVNRAMESALVDVVAAYTPWLASIIPASIGYQNVIAVLHFEPWQAWVYAIVVEFLGLATVSTTLRFWSWNQDASKDRKAPFSLAILTGAFYLVITISVNVILDDGTPTIKLVKALASTFSVVGALVVAMRAQQTKLETAIANAQRAQEANRTNETERWKVEHDAAQKDAQRVHELEMEKLRLEAQERQKDKEAARNIRKELKLAEIQLKLSESVRKVSESSGKVSESSGNFLESFGKFPESWEYLSESFRKFSDWRAVPEDHRKFIAALTIQQIQAIYGTSEKTASNWRKAALEFREAL